MLKRNQVPVTVRVDFHPVTNVVGCNFLMETLKLQS